MKYPEERKRRLVLFLIFALIPIGVSFIAPAIFYHWPLRMHSLATGQDVVLTIPNESLRVALGFVALWVVAFVGAAWGATRLFTCNPQNSSRLKSPADENFKALWKLFILSAVMGSAVAGAHVVIEFSATLEQIVHQLSFMPICAIGLGIHLSSKYGRDFSHAKWVASAVLLALAVVSEMLLPLLAGRAEPLAYGMLTLLFLLMAFRSRAAIPLAFIAVLATTFAMATKSEIRAFGFSGNGGLERVPIADLWRERLAAFSTRIKTSPSQYVLSERIRAFSDSDPNYQTMRWWNQNQVDWRKYTVARVLHRANHLGEFAYVIENTPGAIPYTGMTTYLPAFYVLVPRIVMPNKPSNNSGQFFGHRYHLIWPNDTWTAANLSVVIEGYMSAGTWGVIASAMVLGVFCVVLWMGVVEKGGTLGVIIIGAPLLMAVENSESGFTAIVTGGINAIVVYGLLFLAIRYWLRARVKRCP